MSNLRTNRQFARALRQATLVGVLKGQASLKDYINVQRITRAGEITDKDGNKVLPLDLLQDNLLTECVEVEGGLITAENYGALDWTQILELIQKWLPTVLQLVAAIVALF